MNVTLLHFYRNKGTVVRLVFGVGEFAGSLKNKTKIEEHQGECTFLCLIVYCTVVRQLSPQSVEDRKLTSPTGKWH